VALNGGDVADVAAGIVLDLLTLLRRGEVGLAEIAKAREADAIAQTPGLLSARPFCCARCDSGHCATRGVVLK
jgi:hypothetical protein